MQVKSWPRPQTEKGQTRGSSPRSYEWSRVPTEREGCAQCRSSRGGMEVTYMRQTGAATAQLAYVDSRARFVRFIPGDTALGHRALRSERLH